jgi:hypothetical protein
VRRLAATLLPLLPLLAAAPAVAPAADRASPTVRVRTVPSVSGLAFTFEGRRYLTDDTGSVQIPRAPGTDRRAVLSYTTVGSRQLTSRTTVRFARWLTVGSQAYAALDVYRLTGWRFVDASGSSVPASRIEQIVLRASTGEVRVLRKELARPRWFFSRRVALIHGRVVLRNVDYAVQRVTVLGADVVNAGQQTFSPQLDREVKLRLSFFTLTVQGKDALFGSPVGTHARLVLPNGNVRDLRLSHGRVVIASLPRGNYTIKLTDGVYRLAQPLVLSRSQVAVVPVVTYLDVLAVGGGVLVLALGLVLVGRRSIVRRAGARIAARGRETSPDAQQP